jgi:hypothetical protein
MGPPRSRDIALIIGLLIPVAMILFIAGAIYLPRAFSRVEPPAYDFVYMVGYPYGPVRYVVIDGHLTRETVEDPGTIPPQGAQEILFYIHDVTANSSTRVSFEDASELVLDSARLSPDGFEIVHGRRSEWFFPVSTTDHRTRYLTKESYSNKLHLAVPSEGGYGGSFVFLGWIVEETQWTS